MAAIKTRHLTKRYGDRAVVDDLTLEIAEGEVFGLLGPNGAGKTTTILMLLGLVEPTSGDVEVLGLDPRRHPLTVKRRVGFVPDAVGFYDSMTGRQNLAFTARLNGLEEAEAGIDGLLEEVGLPGDGDRKVGEYSRGMKQRLGLADALVKQPGVLILDEPTTAIDPEGVSDMLGRIRRLANEEQVAILLSSHQLHQVQAVCDRVAIFVDGKVAALGPPHELAGDHGGPARVEFRFDDRGEGPGNLLGELGEVASVAPGRLPGSWVAEVEPSRLADVVREVAAAPVDLVGVDRLDDDLDVVYRRYFDREVAG